MASEESATRALKIWRYHGDYAAAARFASSLPGKLRREPRVALAISELRAAQGYLAEAAQWLQEVNQEAATPSERLLVELELASLEVVSEGTVANALGRAEAARNTAQVLQIDPHVRGKAERIYSQIQLMGALVFELQSDVRDQALERIFGAAESLSDEASDEEAYLAYLTYAGSLPLAESRQRAFTALFDWSSARERTNWQAEVKLRLAEEWLKEGKPTSLIRAEIQGAQNLFTKTGHKHGSLDVQRLQSRLEIERELGDTTGLSLCCDGYRALDFPRAELSVLLDLSQHAFQRGDSHSAADYQVRCLDLAKKVGLLSMLHNSWMSQANLALRSGQYGLVIDLAKAGISSAPSEFFVSAYEHLQATAYSFTNNYPSAIELDRRALSRLEAIGANGLGSDLATSLASHLASLRQDESWTEAEALLQDWVLRDEQRKETRAAVQKRELLVQLAIQQFNFSPSRRHQLAVLDRAEETLHQADQSLIALPLHEATLRHGQIEQLRAQISICRGHPEEAVKHWQSAATLLDSGGAAYESANCHYLIGLQYSNQANKDPNEYFQKAEEELLTALDYYANSGMRVQAVNDRYYLASLHSNATILRPEEEQRLRALHFDTAFDHLRPAEEDSDLIRRGITAGSPEEILEAKRKVAGDSQKVYALHLDLLTRSQSMPEEIWKTCQSAKARALADVLAVRVKPPARFLAAVRANPAAVDQVASEEDLVQRLESAPPVDKLVLQGELSELRQTMATEPVLREYLDLRSGKAVDLRELQEALANTPEQRAGFVAIDWFVAGRQLWLLACRAGKPVQCVRLDLTLAEVATFVDEHLREDSFRFTLREVPELLQRLAPAIAPLARITQPEELLILSPTGPLHRIPLHALHLEGEPLLVRNPVVYCPSLTVLYHCLSHNSETPARPSAALFGDPKGDRQATAALVARLGKRLTSRVVLGSEVSRANFVEGVEDRRLIHFQGHAKQLADAPLDSYLELTDGKFTARDVLSLQRLRANLVTLAGCETAASPIAPGDEPLGLVPAFLYSGASSILASLWSVQDEAATRVMEEFYETWLSAAEKLDKAQALRSASLKVRATKNYEAPYYWAAFTLHGDWR